jgi:hypothetical protein
MAATTRLAAAGSLIPALLLGAPLSAWCLEAAVRDLNGSPTLFVNGQPTSPLMFFGWAGGAGPTVAQVDTEWRELSLTFVASEDNEGNAGIHFRMGGYGPGTVWVDNVQLYPGPRRDLAPGDAANMLRQPDFEGTREEFARDWSHFEADYAGAKATWELDPTTSATGKQSLKVTIENAGGDGNTMHVHGWQTGHSVRRGQTYTYTLWMKADRPRTVDFMALHIGSPWTIYSPVDGAYEQQVKLSAGVGVHIQTFGIDCPWPRPGEAPDFGATDKAIELTLSADPQALLLPRFGMAPPAWWQEAHPGDRMLFEDGKVEDFTPASAAWRRDFEPHLRALVKHCEEKYGDHMLGYHPCGQHTGEWFYQRSWEPVLSDFSPAMGAGFQAWARETYQTEAALRAAWNDPGATFDTIAAPRPEDLRGTSLGLFRDPAREQRVIDYFAYKQLAMEQPLERMARIVKEETGGRKLTCLFYGYLFDMHGLPLGPQGSGHLAMSRLANCPDVDILCSPISYNDRELGGAGCFMSAVDTVRNAGKLWLNEDDTRTYLTSPADGFGRVDTAQGTYWVHQRNFGQIFPRRLAAWYMDLGGVGWLNGKDIWDNIAPLQRFYQSHISEPADWRPEVAVIVDEDSPFYTACTRDLHSPLVYEMRSQLNRLGCAVSFHLLSDLQAGRVPPAKAYILLNAFHLDDAQRVAVREAIRGRTAVWFYGAGLINRQADEANMAALTGLSYQRIVPQRAQVQPVPGSPLTAGLTAGFGGETLLDPCWEVSGAGSEVLARYAGGQAAAAALQTAEGLRVSLGTVWCPAALLRNVLKASGVHLYCDSDDIVFAGDGFLGLSATSAGAKTLRLPAGMRVTDALTGAQVSAATTEIPLTLALGEVRLFTVSAPQP